MKVSIMGSGSWATAIALLLRDKHEVVLWGRDEQKIKSMQAGNKNPHLPDQGLAGITFTSDRRQAILGKGKSGYDVYIVAIPSKYLKEQLETFTPYVEQLKKIRLEQHTEESKLQLPNNGLCFVSLTKGFEDKTWQSPTEMIAQALNLGENDLIFSLSGPSHAEEVALKMPTMVTLAARDLKNNQRMQTAKQLQTLFRTTYFKTYISEDIETVEMAAATKNIIAIAGGICSGLGFGSNSMAALISRGLKEMERFIEKVKEIKAIHRQKNGKNNSSDFQPHHGKTLYGLAGVGDLIATAQSKHSRNHRLGVALAQGISFNDFLNQTGMVCEGANVVKAVNHFSKKHAVYMPITDMVYRVLFQEYAIKQAVAELMDSGSVEEFV